MLMRYSICILGGAGNHARPEISDDIVSAILKARADKHNPAVYWLRQEQERRLEAVFQKWAARGAWNAAAAKTHKEQMKHVRKGCLTRPRNDVPSDGSRIEGSHRAWNGLQRSYSSGLEMLTSLSHDHILRRNHRIDLDSRSPTPFAMATYGSHHLRLVNRAAQLWNEIRRASTLAPLFAGLQDAPTFLSVNSRESFGIVQSQFAAGYQYFIDVKEEPGDDMVDLSTQPPQQARQLLQNMNIDPALLSQPLSAPATSIDAMVSTYPSARYGDSLRSPTMNAVSVCDQNQDTGISRPESQASGLRGEVPDITLASVSETKSQPAGPSIESPVLDTTPHAHIPADTLATIDETMTSLPTTLHKDGGNIGSQRASLKRKLLSDKVILDAHGQPSHPEHSAKKAKSLVPWEGGSRLSETSSRTPSATPLCSRSPEVSSPLSQCSNTVSRSASVSNALAGPTAPTRRNGDIQEYFAVSRRPGVRSIGSKLSTPGGSSKDNDLNSKLPAIDISGLSPLQRIFSIATGLNPMSTSISSGDEFFLFMNLRAGHKWVSHNMTPQKWVEAAALYNMELEKADRRLGHFRGTVQKTPRALMDKLGDIEPIILRRLSDGDYK
ncbi:hypothetical protein C8Q78DRAFT_413566 [Trametes maxima]|nr:hypothetical protein C8Q78DRAFT_413566 [Trametes maxima]